MSLDGISTYPADFQALAARVSEQAARDLYENYADREKRQLGFALSLTQDGRDCFFGGQIWKLCSLLQELTVPGGLLQSWGSQNAPADFEAFHNSLNQLGLYLFQTLNGFYQEELEAKESRHAAAAAALGLVARLPEIRQHAQWNIFASLKDPAVWDSFLLRHETRRKELGSLDLISVIDLSIDKRDMKIYAAFLEESGFGSALDYQKRLVRSSYSGWKALFLHDVSYTLAVGGKVDGLGIAAIPVPMLPRILSEYGASLHQTDLHPETVIGDANFMDHTHRGITTGQTGSIGRGCVIYPCTLGGITDKVKPRHPHIGDFVLIGTDVGIFGPVTVDRGAVIGANTEINGMVEISRNVRIRAAVVARTVISESGKPGKILFEEGVTVGEECLIINDHPTDLVVPAGTALPAGSQVSNDGNGNPKIN